LRCKPPIEPSCCERISAGVYIFGRFFDNQDGGSTYMRIDLYAHTYGTYPYIYLSWWRRPCGVVASVVCRMNEVTVWRARLVLGWVTIFGRVYRHST